MVLSFVSFLLILEVSFGLRNKFSSSGCSGVLLAVVGGAGEAEEEQGEEPSGGDGDERPSVSEGRIFTEGKLQSS